jgi:hypothetical protein
VVLGYAKQKPRDSTRPKKVKKEEQKMKKRMPALRLGTPMETSFVMGVKVSGQVAMIWLTQLLCRAHGIIGF